MFGFIGNALLILAIAVISTWPHSGGRDAAQVTIDSVAWFLIGIHVGKMIKPRSTTAPGDKERP